MEHKTKLDVEQMETLFNAVQDNPDATLAWSTAALDMLKNQEKELRKLQWEFERLYDSAMTVAILIQNQQAEHILLEAANNLRNWTEQTRKAQQERRK